MHKDDDDDEAEEVEAGSSIPQDDIQKQNSTLQIENGPSFAALSATAHIA